jgi:hypothetical protein
MSNVIVEPAQASAIACRRLPSPLSVLVMTTGLLVHGAVAIEAALPFAEFRSVESPPRVDLNE